jgi:2-dehydro-3-deoxyphosphogluconate aldolase/(4S)-4-hydroxy-2-oxoglutarate aldolase
MRIDEICRLSPVIPVIVIDDAVPLAETLVAAGLRVLEVTLRTPVALAALERIATAVPDAVVGVGTVRTGADIAAARSAGARFGVSPGTPDALRDAILVAGLPFLPGCSTVTEAMTLAAVGFSTLKLFPAEAVGGRALLNALISPLPHFSFCPHGGYHRGYRHELPRALECTLRGWVMDGLATLGRRPPLGRHRRARPGGGPAETVTLAVRRNSRRWTGASRVPVPQTDANPTVQPVVSLTRQSASTRGRAFD